MRVLDYRPTGMAEIQLPATMWGGGWSHGAHLCFRIGLNALGKNRPLFPKANPNSNSNSNFHPSVKVHQRLGESRAYCLRYTRPTNGWRFIQWRAMSTRLLIHTRSCLSIWSRNCCSARKRPGRPSNRQCMPTDSIFGVSAPSA